MSLVLRLNLEAFVAGVDLDGLADTDEAEGAADYDDLRALAPSELTSRFTGFAPGWLAELQVQAQGMVVPLAVSRLNVPEAGDITLPRFSTLALEGPLPGGARELTLTWPDGSGDLVLRQQGVEAPFTGYLTGGETSQPIVFDGGGARSGMGTFLDYIPVGFDHILPKGLDHILFVLGLFFLSLRLGALLWQISAFTLAHTVTLALGALGWVVVPGAVVEPLIAASIVFVAVENILAQGLKPWRPFVVFCFGLLHGLGFASVLEDFGLPEGQLVPALLGFNLGVEIGQLTVIAIAFLAVGAWFGRKPWYRARITVPASCVIAIVGGWWVIERVFL